MIADMKESVLKESIFGAKACALGLPDKLLYTLTEVSTVTGVPRSTLVDELKAGRIRHVLPAGRTRGILIGPDWVDDWLERGTRGEL